MNKQKQMPCRHSVGKEHRKTGKTGIHNKKHYKIKKRDALDMFRGCRHSIYKAFFPTVKCFINPPNERDCL